MKKYFLITLVLVLAVSINAQDKTGKDTYLIKLLSNEIFNNAELRTSGGNISVAGVSTSEARIEVYVYPNNSKNNLSKEEIQKQLTERYDLDISVINNKLVAIAKAKDKITDWWKNGLTISFKLFVPKNIFTNLSTSGGSISLINLSANQEFSTSGGSLNVDNVNGKINGRTSGGSINLENSGGDIELSTSGGSINASHCKGNLKLRTSGGSLNLGDLDGDINASTSGGSIEGRNIGGELVSHTSGGSIHLTDLTCSLETSTSGGNIEVSIITLGKYVKISNSSGHIELKLPKGKGLDLDLSADKITTGHFENFTGKIDDDVVKGKLNGGGIPVTVNAGSGKIVLELK
jgi:hypothetical protein